MITDLSYLIRSIVESLLTFASITTPIVLFFVAYIRNKRAEHELRMRLLENNSNPELVKALIESKPKSQPKLVLLRIGLPAIFASLFGFGFFYWMNTQVENPNSFDGAPIMLIFIVVFGIGLGLISALLIERKLLKKAEETK
jgi:ABC-type dipeptide/oligopeptide/nickel transport system permease component